MNRLVTTLFSLFYSHTALSLGTFGKTILGHTNEFLGGRGSVTTMMKARSSMGRNFIEVCKCAGSVHDPLFFFKSHLSCTGSHKH
jgi:hypothetical protein